MSKIYNSIGVCPQIDDAYTMVEDISNKVRFGNLTQKLLNILLQGCINYFKEVKDESGVKFSLKYHFYCKLEFAKRKRDFDELFLLCFEIENFETNNFETGYYRPSHTKLFCYSLYVLGMTSYKKGNLDYTIKLLTKSKITLENLLLDFPTYYKVRPLLFKVTWRLNQIKKADAMHRL